MKHPSELPTEPIVGATINNTADSHVSKQSLAHTASSSLVPSPTIESLPKPTFDFDPHVGAKPCSPFYRHNNNDSLEHLKNEATISAERYGSNDLENGLSNTSHKRSVEIHGVCRSKLWAEKKRRFDCLSSLTKKQRLAVKLLIAFIIVGAMVGIALGITAAVGGGVWKSKNQQGAIGS
ncbi:hypothetical protein BGW36DRAFT_373787 [Talaromyces proteolyticus]|uniref:Uncharacterized protein n=1 Tax=Talaromyces proteolyticus TaxID=1131652 RepID=A0AAD4PZY5_9EURO|nr:uncharacterized protein BGW36DRAFT_373787 [Talaromyces proteolyticus]KAH8700279.1 hypothetical protein BGW36DRAFT_373787 [Talaromyces proteolyticus]